MNIHEYQAKAILKEFGIRVPKGLPIFSLSEIDQKYKILKTEKIALKAQIHAGGRGKAGGIKLVKSIEELKNESNKLLGKKLVTPQTSRTGTEVKKLYLEEICDIKREFYLSCLIDRASSKIAFISSVEGGMDIENVAKNNPEKIITTKINLSKSIDEKDIEKIIKPFVFSEELKKQAAHLIQSIYKILVEKDANLIEINPLVVTKKNELICLDAKINFDDNALFRHPDIANLRDFNEEDPSEVEARKYNLSYIKLNGSIGCMVNGAGLAMATLDIIKLYGKEPANFLDVGGGASKEQVSAAFKIILSDKNVKGILVNIFGGILRCDELAKGLVEAAQETQLHVPLVVRLSGTNFEQGKKILSDSDLKIMTAVDLGDAAKKITEAVK
jgi:succinyl-CoA synthetase beta subunit